MENSKEIIMTSEGYKKLEEELEYLKVVKRKEVSEKIKTALGFGDLSENSEYDEAKNEQAQVEARIAQLEANIKYAKIVDDDDTSTDAVKVGVKVRVLDIEFDEEEEYSIVGSTEADPYKKKVSNESPLGKALIGKKAGDIVEVAAPVGVIKYKVLEISR